MAGGYGGVGRGLLLNRNRMAFGIDMATLGLQSHRLVGTESYFRVASPNWIQPPIDAAEPFLRTALCLARC